MADKTTIMTPAEVAEKMHQAIGIQMELGDWAALHTALIGMLNTANENLAMGRLPWPTTDMGHGREDINKAMQSNTVIVAAEICDRLSQMLESEFGTTFKEGAPKLHGVARDTSHLN